ncbi:MAG: ribose 5-phosphate isomerase B [Candidatus Omnitrophica bacterium]|jgi:ribose 5-phosphate isomerase B|nr:ribose 5-phosphate isomerase B [Candidatus Omnitrophota bacterium]
MEKIVVGSDHGGFYLKEELKGYLGKKGFTVKDAGTYSTDSCDYPDTAYAAAREVSLGRYKKGVLICKSGIGNSIVANKLPNVRAALCFNLKTAKLSRMHNDANVLVLGASFVDKGLAKRILSAWLNTKFEGGRHIRRLNKIKAIERKVRGGRI